jgi:hypothetical protein
MQMDCIILVTNAILALKPSWDFEKTKKDYSEIICQEAEKRNIDPLIGIALAHHETGFNKNIVYYNRNRSKDYGLMQFNCDRTNTVYFRRFWCNKIWELRTIGGSVKAGFEELAFWRDHGIGKRGDKLYLSNFVEVTGDDALFPVIGVNTKFSLYNSNLDWMFKEKYRVTRECHDCFERAKFSNKITVEQIEDIEKSFWWVKHYNFMSPNYYFGVLYVYKVLVEQRTELYKLVQKSLHRRFLNNGTIRTCVKKQDMCLSRIPQGYLI